MNKVPLYKEPLSTSLRPRLNKIDLQTLSALRWLAIVSLFIFLALLVVALLQHNDTQALVLAIGILPILIALLLIRQGRVSLPSALLAINFVLLVTWLASNGNGIYDAGVIAFPLILIVVGLILREKFIAYLTVLIILCVGWLVFGDMVGLYAPNYPVESHAQDFFLISIVILMASNSIYLLVRSVHHSLEKAEQEIEARTKAEQQREDLIQELKLKNQELNRFAVTVSHDLKTPLITISGFLGYLEKDAQAGNYERLQKNISQINSAAKQMGRFVDQILDLSRVGRIINPPENIPFGDIVQEALRQAQGLLNMRQVEVQLESAYPVVHVDHVRMVQVLQNLIANSVKFMGEQTDPCIKIGVKTIDGNDAFFVSDNGIGIATQDQHGIFELFNKLDPRSEGTGIGLAVVKRIIEVHGGKIWVESEPEKGATFFFTLEKEVQQGE